MYEIEFTARFKKDLKRCHKRGCSMDELNKAVEYLQQTGTLPKRYRPHVLSGNYANLWECHIRPDWLMIWKQDNEKLTLVFMYSGSHSDLF